MSSSCVDIHGNLYRFGKEIGSPEQPIIKFHFPSPIIQISLSILDNSIVVQDINKDLWEVSSRKFIKLEYKEMMNIHSNENINKELLEFNIFDHVNSLKRQYVSKYL